MTNNIEIELYNGPCLHTEEEAQRIANTFSKGYHLSGTKIAEGPVYHTIVQEPPEIVCNRTYSWRVTNRFDPRVKKCKENNNV